MGDCSKEVVKNSESADDTVLDMTLAETVSLYEDSVVQDPVRQPLLPSSPDLEPLIETVRSVTINMDSQERNTPDEVTVAMPLSPPAEHTQQQLHILIVDDSETNRIVLKRMTTKIYPNCRLSEAVNGLEAVNLCKESLKSKDVPISIILMDIIMPVMGGFDATKAIRSLGCTVPIIATTANNTNTEEFKRQMETFGMSDAISKPFTVSMLRETFAKFKLL